MMADATENETIVREIAAEIAKFREEFWDTLSTEIDGEIEEIENSGYDPAKGNGRGPWWAEGA